ncbi:MAG: hypothetical protein LDL33_01715 [Desulfomonile sp.]|nr:hypothetical protein [Desulfomonile sp.]
MDKGDRKKLRPQSRGAGFQVGSTGNPAAEDAAQSFFESLSTTFYDVTSGDEETDRAIDLAVDTLFVEEPETPPPETTEVQATMIDEITLEEPPPPRPEGPLEVERFEEPVASPSSAYDLAAELGLDEFKDTELEGAFEAKPEPVPAPPPARVERMTAPKPRLETAPPVQDMSLRKLEEAILTLEWEISRRSVTVLASELKKVRTRFQDNVTVDFAALAMRVVLDYIIKRMSRAHPESIRFLLEVTDYLKGAIASSRQDPLVAFDRILGRYEAYKSAVRRAEGIPDSSPAILRELEVTDPKAFYEMVKSQAATLAMAGRSLAERLNTVEAPENLIRSFRFLATRSFNRILESTRKKGVSTQPPPKKTARR